MTPANQSRLGCADAFGLGFFGGLMLVTGVIVFATPSASETQEKWQKAAVDHGAAEYVMDPKTGKVTWQWKGEK